MAESGKDPDTDPMAGALEQGSDVTSPVEVMDEPWRGDKVVSFAEVLDELELDSDTS